VLLENDKFIYIYTAKNGNRVGENISLACYNTVIFIVQNINIPKTANVNKNNE